MGPGQPDVQAQGGGLGHEADGEQDEDPGRDRLRHLGERGQGQLRGTLGRQGEAGQEQEGATQGKEEVGQGVGLGGPAAQDEEIGTDGQQFPGGEELEAVLGQDQDRQPGVHEQGGGVEADALAPDLIAGEQDQGPTDQEDEGEDQPQGVVEVIGGGEKGQQADDGQAVFDAGRQPFQRQEEQGEGQGPGQKQLGLSGPLPPQPAQAPGGGQGDEDGDELVVGAGEGHRVGPGQGAFDDVAKPAEEIAGLQQGAEEDQTQQGQPVPGDELMGQLPLGIEAGKGRQAGEQGQEADQGQDQERSGTQGDPVRQVSPPDQPGQPVEPRLGHRVTGEEAHGDEEIGVAEEVALADDHQHQPGLGHRGVAQQASVLVLGQGEEVGGEEAHQADGRRRLQPRRTANGQHLVHGEEGGGAAGGGEQGGEGGVSGLIDIQRPAVGGEGLQLRYQGDEHQQEGDPPAGLQDPVLTGAQDGGRACQAVEVEGAAGMVGEEDADQQQH